MPVAAGCCRRPRRSTATDHRRWLRAGRGRGVPGRGAGAARALRVDGRPHRLLRRATGRASTRSARTSGCSSTSRRAPAGRRPGVEPSAWAVSEGRPGSGSTSARARPRPWTSSRGSVDAMVMLDVLEHLSDPLSDAATAPSGRARAMGMLALSTVNVEGLHGRIRRGSWPWFIRSHLHYFSPPTLIWMLPRSRVRRGGMEGRAALLPPVVPAAPGGRPAPRRVGAGASVRRSPTRRSRSAGSATSRSWWLARPRELDHLDHRRTVRAPSNSNRPGPSRPSSQHANGTSA